MRQSWNMKTSLNRPINEVHNILINFTISDPFSKVISTFCERAAHVQSFWNLLQVTSWHLCGFNISVLPVNQLFVNLSSKSIESNGKHWSPAKRAIFEVVLEPPTPILLLRSGSGLARHINVLFHVKLTLDCWILNTFGKTQMWSYFQI